MTVLNTKRVDEWLEHLEKNGNISGTESGGAITTAYATLLLAREVAKLRYALVEELYEIRNRIENLK